MKKLFLAISILITSTGCNHRKVRVMPPMITYFRPPAEAVVPTAPPVVEPPKETPEVEPAPVLMKDPEPAPKPKKHRHKKHLKQTVEEVPAKPQEPPEKPFNMMPLLLGSAVLLAGLILVKGKKDQKT